jgi:hypothetical protein
MHVTTSIRAMSAAPLLQPTLARCANSGTLAQAYVMDGQRDDPHARDRDGELLWAA